MTIIDDVSTNDTNFKHLDTAKDIVITPRNEFGGQVLLNTAHTWNAKVSDGNNYVGDYPVTLESNSIVVNSADFTNLPAGYYHLEIWEEWTDSNGSKQRSIYPSPQRTIDFTIYQNVTDLAEKEIKTIGFQDVVDQAVMNIGMNYVFKVNTIEPDQTATVVQAAADGKNYVTFNIPRGYKGDKGDTGPQGPVGPQGPQGPKGDTGSVDNDGLTNAPAFQALQTQVNDSAVGTNLLTGTSSEKQGYSLSSDSGSQGINDTPNHNCATSDGSWAAGDTYTYRAYISNAGGTGTIQVACWDKTFNLLKTFFGNNVQKGDWGYSSVTFAIPENTYYMNFSAVRTAEPLTSNYFSWKEEKLEKGSVATDWSPNPSEILTQSDYAKIKAAIVALGGSLS